MFMALPHVTMMTSFNFCRNAALQKPNQKGKKVEEKQKPNQKGKKQEEKQEKRGAGKKRFFALEMKANVKQSFWYTICFSSLIIYLYSER